MHEDPLTGKKVAWRIYSRTYGCNYPVASEHMLMFRSAAAGLFRPGDRRRHRQFRRFQVKLHVEPDCRRRRARRITRERAPVRVPESDVTRAGSHARTGTVDEQRPDIPRRGDSSRRAEFRGRGGPPPNRRHALVGAPQPRGNITEALRAGDGHARSIFSTRPHGSPARSISGSRRRGSRERSISRSRSTARVSWRWLLGSISRLLRTTPRRTPRGRSGSTAAILLELTEDATEQVVGLRYTHLEIPQGAKIDLAYIQFKADEKCKEKGDPVIEAQAADDSATFSKTDKDVSKRPRTKAKVAWKVPTWDKEGEAGGDQRTPSLIPLIEEVVSRPGWQSDNSIAFLITGEGEHIARAFRQRSGRLPDAVHQAQGRQDSHGGLDGQAAELQRRADVRRAGRKHHRTGKHVFDVLLQGKVVLNKFDIAATAGTKRLVTREFRNMPVNGKLNVSLRSTGKHRPTVGLRAISWRELRHRSRDRLAGGRRQAAIPMHPDWLGVQKCVSPHVTAMPAASTPP